MIFVIFLRKAGLTVGVVGRSAVSLCRTLGRYGFGALIYGPVLLHVNGSPWGLVGRGSHCMLQLSEGEHNCWHDRKLKHEEEG